ncbi:MAG: BspA family leucine-rich repeat surface protein, partial [Lachnospiraceae bacterium]|nr:BspA family leucine-rich repeat surface protein [Lachnospiraceae bacterium]
VVGWDDNYSADNFGGNYKPDGNGAWIVKNSWGETFGENGYFYISYEDTSLGSGNPASVAIAAKTDTYDNNYFYGNTTYLSSTRFTAAVKVSQVYQTKNEEEGLEAVSVMLNSDQVDYSIQIYKNPQLVDGIVKNPESGTPMLEIPLTGTTGYAGLYTIDFPKAIAFKEGDYMAVVINIPANKLINIDATDADKAVSSPYQVLYENNTHPGQSLWFNGREWIDTAESSNPYNFRINALTTTIDSSEPLAAPAFTPAAGILEEGQLVTIEAGKGARIYYTLDGTEPTAETGIRYTKPLEITEDVTIRAAAVRGEETKAASASYQYYRMKPVLSETELELAKNRVHKLSVLQLPTGSTEQTVSFESSNENVVTVDKDGLLIGISAGNAAVMVKAKDYNGKETSAVCKVTVTDTTDIAGGNYEGIIWFIDADGKLTVEGTGEFAPAGSEDAGADDHAMLADKRIPWISECEKITSAEINVTGMTDASYMFYGCRNLTDVNLNKFDTSQVINMTRMFYGCCGLENIDLSTFDTSRVKYMAGMFSGCEKLRSLNLSSFDTSSVTDMYGLFEGCLILKEIDLKHFNTGKVTDMSCMFSECQSLTSIDLSHFDTSNVTGMAGMFYGCRQLAVLDLSSFDMGKTVSEKQYLTWTEKLSDMFKECFNLSAIYVPANLPHSIPLPLGGGDDIWYQPEGEWCQSGETEITELPKNLKESILITKNERPKVSYLTVGKTKTDYECGETIVPDDLTVSYVNHRGMPAAALTTADYTTNADEIDLSTPGVKTLIITHKDGETGKEVTAEIELTAVYILREGSLLVSLSEEY